MLRVCTAMEMANVLESNMSGAQKLLHLRAMECAMVFDGEVNYSRSSIDTLISSLSNTNVAGIVKDFLQTCSRLSKKHAPAFVRDFHVLAERRLRKIIEKGFLDEFYAYLDEFMKSVYYTHYHKNAVHSAALLVNMLVEFIKELPDVDADWADKFNEDGSLNPSAEIALVGRSLNYYKLMVASAEGRTDLKSLELRYVEEALNAGFDTGSISQYLEFAYGERHYFTETFSLASRSLRSVLPLLHYSGGTGFAKECAKLLMATRAGDFHFYSVRDFGTLSQIRRLLKVRNYKLPAGGVTANFLSAGDVKSMYLKEVFVDGKVVLLWRINLFDHSTFGYYVPEVQQFYSDFSLLCGARATSGVALEHFVLETYSHMVCEEVDIVKDKEQELVILNQGEELLDYYQLLGGNKYVPPIVKFDYEISREDWESPNKVKADVKVAQNMYAAAKLMDVTMNDFIIIGNGYNSFREHEISPF